MHAKCGRLAGVLACAAVVLLGGCTQSPLQTSVDMPLGDTLGRFDVTADEPTDRSGTSTIDAPVTVGSGSITIEPDAISVTPSGALKEMVQAQEGGSELIVTVWIDAVENVESVCGGGEDYGPFTVSLDENFVPQSVEPANVTLTQNTLDLINAGEFSICIRVVSPVTGQVQIQALALRLGL